MTIANDSDSARPLIEDLQERTSRLCQAILRISASLDLDTVLQEVIDSARVLTNASYGVLTTIDNHGRPLQVLSSGITSDEHRQMTEWADGLKLFAHLRDQPGPLRVGDLPGYLRSLGLNPDVVPFKTAQGTPIHHRGALVGTLFVAQKESGHEFTDADEEVLLLFASQAATCIANARSYRDEHRARANLEALVDTSPIGVLVIDARTGDIVLTNREAKRIVEALQMPGRAPEQLVELLTCRRADGREVGFAEFPMAEVCSTAETVRNEEMTLSVPDGRSIKTLINVTPIQAPDGGVESVVVTLQDLAPFDDIERMRTEFLAIVSHELRTPLTSIKGATTTVLDASPGFAPAEMLQFFRIIDGQANQMSGLIGDLLDAGRIATGTLSVSPESSEAGALVDRARNAFLSGGGLHSILVDLPPDLPRVMVDRQRIIQVLANLFSNAARHAPESSPIQVAARRDGAHVAISVTDRGRGIPRDQLPHMFRKSTGTGDGERGLRRGLGLAICKGLVEAHGGRIWAASEGEGRGARFTFTVPVAEGEGGGSREEAALTGDGAAAQRQGRQRTRVLVVDDDAHTLRYVRDVLTAARYSPLVTGDHSQLSHLIRTEKPSLSCSI